MPKRKGSPKTGGRKKGTQNKVSQELRAMINEAIDLPTFKRRLKSIKSDSQYCMIVLKLMEFALPKLKSVEHTGENKQLLNIILPDRIRPEDIKEILEDAEEEEL